MAAPKKAVSIENAPRAGELTTSGLMRQMGSRDGSFSPLPPDDIAYRLRHARGSERGLAWVQARTIGHQGRRTPYATDDVGQPVGLEVMAAELKWSEQTCRNVVNELAADGRVRVDEEGRIWLCADIPAAFAELLEGEEKENDDSWFNFVQSYVASYLRDSISNLPVEQRDRFRDRYSWMLSVRKDVFAEAAAKARVITDQFEDTILSEFGIEKKRIAKRRDPEARFLKVEPIADLNSVQSYEGSSLYSGKSTDVQTENGQCTNPPSLLNREESRVACRHASEEPASEPENTGGQLLEGLRRWFPGEQIADSALIGLDRRLKKGAGAEYNPFRFIQAVAQRATRGKIRFGLLLDTGKESFVAHWIASEAAATAERAAAEQKQQAELEQATQSVRELADYEEWREREIARLKSTDPEGWKKRFAEACTRARQENPHYTRQGVAERAIVLIARELLPSFEDWREKHATA